MNSLIVELKERSYPIVISSKMEEFIPYLEVIDKKQRIVIVTDHNVAEYYLELLEIFLRDMGYRIFNYNMKAGEESKSLNVVSQIYSYLLENKITKNDVLIALGGGVVGDITGFIAATYLRGISYVQMPTTLLAQVDSSVGGKTGVNFNYLKNIIGAFYQPRLVLINPMFLKTLPKSQIQVGLAEIIVHCIISDEPLFTYLEQYLDNIYNFDMEVLSYIIHKNCLIKSKFVKLDENDTGMRALLNFGHTIGHAIEAVSQFNMTHGEAVSIGIVGAFLLAGQLKVVEQGERDRVVNLLNKVGLPTYLASMEPEKVYDQMLYDKKVQQDSLVFILPVRVGEVKIIKVIDKEIIFKVLNDLKRKI